MAKRFTEAIRRGGYESGLLVGELFLLSNAQYRLLSHGVVGRSDNVPLAFVNHMELHVPKKEQTNH